MMGSLSQHFNRWEFKCKCGECDKDTVDYRLVVILERLRAHTKEPITVTSGNRCVLHNEKVGGSPNSQHLFGKAADIQVRGWSPEAVYNLLDYWYPDELGLGLYRSWVHIDVRNGKSRWNKT